MDVIDAVMSRKSVRSFAGTPVAPETVELLLRAAMNAPSAGNSQPWRFVVVTDAPTREALAEATPYAGPMRKAPLGIVICAEPAAEKFPGRWPLDCSAAMENMLLVAFASGLGGVWLGVHPEPDREREVARILGLPDGIVPVAMLAAGTPERVPAPVDRYNADHVHHERW